MTKQPDDVYRRLRDTEFSVDAIRRLLPLANDLAYGPGSTAEGTKTKVGESNPTLAIVADERREEMREAIKEAERQVKAMDYAAAAAEKALRSIARPYRSRDVLHLADPMGTRRLDDSEMEPLVQAQVRRQERGEM